MKISQSCWLFAPPWIVVHGILQARILEWVGEGEGNPTQASNPGLPYCRPTLYQLSHQGSQGSTSGKEYACQCRRHKRSRFDWGPEDPLKEAWQPTPVFLPGKFHRQRSLAGYSPWGCREQDRAERLSTHMKAASALWVTSLGSGNYSALSTLGGVQFPNVANLSVLTFFLTFLSSVVCLCLFKGSIWTCLCRIVILLKEHIKTCFTNVKNVLIGGSMGDAESLWKQQPHFWHGSLLPAVCDTEHIFKIHLFFRLFFIQKWNIYTYMYMCMYFYTHRCFRVALNNRNKIHWGLLTWVMCTLIL